MSGGPVAFPTASAHRRLPVIEMLEGLYSRANSTLEAARILHDDLAGQEKGH